MENQGLSYSGTTHSFGISASRIMLRSTGSSPGNVSPSSTTPSSRSIHLEKCPRLCPRCHRFKTFHPASRKSRPEEEKQRNNGGNNSAMTDTEDGSRSRSKSKLSSYILHRSPAPQSLNAAVEMLSSDHGHPPPFVWALRRTSHVQANRDDGDRGDMDSDRVGGVWKGCRGELDLHWQRFGRVYIFGSRC